MTLVDKRGEEKGKSAETFFKNWLDKNKTPYWYIQQDINTLSPALREEFSGKRADFMILLPNFGFMLVDVKYRKMNKEFGTFPIDVIDAKRFSSLQRTFNLPIWFVISNEEYNYKTWMWIPVSKVFEEGVVIKRSSLSQDEFFSVPVKNFIQVSDDDSLKRLFSRL